MSRRGEPAGKQVSRPHGWCQSVSQSVNESVSRRGSHNQSVSQLINQPGRQTHNGSVGLSVNDLGGRQLKRSLNRVMGERASQPASN